MKPGLRKIAALILASATLFGGGVLSASTAYADDTTLDTSTQLQAEPDTQTTMGGDVSETTPDNGSDNEAGTDTDNQSDDTTPQTNVGQAAPDVTIHDMLDTDSAAVSRLRLTDRITGTAPFDKDNARGDDKDENNDIVRSYDTVTYDYEYTLTPDSTMDYYRRTRVGFRFELPYPRTRSRSTRRRWAGWTTRPATSRNSPRKPSTGLSRRCTPATVCWSRPASRRQ